MKVNNAELCENVRFQMVARADLSAHLKKRKMKALVPQIIQILYFGALCILFAGSLAISRGSFDSCSMVSFLTSLVFLIEPIQVILDTVENFAFLFLFSPMITFSQLSLPLINVGGFYSDFLKFLNCLEVSFNIFDLTILKFERYY